MHLSAVARTFSRSMSILQVLRPTATIIDDQQPSLEQVIVVYKNAAIEPFLAK